MKENIAKAGICFCLVTLATFTFVFRTQAAANLLSNPGAETGDFTGWTLTQNGGSGWAVTGLAHSGSHGFTSSFSQDTMDQVVDLVAAGYSTSYLDSQPEIDMSDWIIGYGAGCNTSDPYSITVTLENSSHGAVASYTTGNQTTGSSWAEVSHAFTGYGTGVRYVDFQQGGQDDCFWLGNYGATFDDASVTVSAPLADTTPPIVEVTLPIADSVVGGSAVTLAASSTDNVAVAGVTFYVDNKEIGSETTSSSTIFSTTWDSTATTGGTHSVFAVSRDTSNNYATSSNVSFVVDNNPPSILSIASTTGSNDANITWATDESASSLVNFGTTTSYSSSTIEADTNPRVINHSVTLSGLLPCTLYYFQVESRDAIGNIGTSTDETFFTTGCPIPAPSDNSTASSSIASMTPIANHNSSVSQTSSGGSVQSQYANLVAMGFMTQAQALKWRYDYLFDVKDNDQNNATTAATSTFVQGATLYSSTTVITTSTSTHVKEFTRYLEEGMSGADVLNLQKFLNAQGFIVATSGPGSIGNETDYFGGLTKAALSDFQKAHQVDILAPNELTAGNGVFGLYTMELVNKIINDR